MNKGRKTRRHKLTSRKRWSSLDVLAVSLGGPTSTPMLWDKEYINSVFKVRPNAKDVPTLTATINKAIVELSRPKRAQKKSA